MILLSDIPDGARWDQQLLKAMLAKGNAFIIILRLFMLVKPNSC